MMLENFSIIAYIIGKHCKLHNNPYHSLKINA
jgi:hypothetical protein